MSTKTGVAPTRAIAPTVAKNVRRSDDLVAGADVLRQRQTSTRRCPRRCRRHVRTRNTGRWPAHTVRPSAQDEMLRLEDLRNRGVNIGFDGPVLRFEIE
jgi:hypothetical protein